MKIADKIRFLVLFLLATLVLSVYVSLRQVSQVADQFRRVTQTEIALTDISGAVTRNYLENAVRFQAVLSAGDELAFVEMTPARRQYLTSHIRQIKLSFDAATQSTAEVIVRGKELLETHMRQAAFRDQEQEFANAAELLRRIEAAYVGYDQLFSQTVQMIQSGSFQLSIEDVRRVNAQERSLSTQIKSLLDEIRQSTHNALRKAGRDEEVIRRMLTLGLLLAILISIVISVMIIRSFSGPLKKLVTAANTIGQGHWELALETQRKDEIGELSAAFAVMTAQLREFKAKLLEQNTTLSENLTRLRVQKQDLEKANRELDQFVHTVSHDIAQPLTGIVAYSAILEDHYAAQLDERGRKSVSGIHKSAKRLGAMINDLLSLTRMSRIQNPFEKTDCLKIFEEAQSRLEYMVSQTRAKIELVGELPVIVCDRIKMTEIFFNLLSNAIKFSSRPGALPPLIQVGCRQGAECYEFYVKDNGIGIAPQYHREVFDIFKRLETAADFEGTGAGLSIVKAAVEDHGGEIWIDSRPGEGTVVHFTISRHLVNRPLKDTTET